MEFPRTETPVFRGIAKVMQMEYDLEEKCVKPESSESVEGVRLELLGCVGPVRNCGNWKAHVSLRKWNSVKWKACLQ